MSYHNLFITTPTIKRTALRDLPFSLHVSCTRAGGWELWDMSTPERLIAGEYECAENWLVLDVSGHTIVDSRRPIAQCGCEKHAQEKQQ